jgi:hypothetical protein
MAKFPPVLIHTWNASSPRNPDQVVAVVVVQEERGLESCADNNKVYPKVSSWDFWVHPAISGTIHIGSHAES